MMDKVLASGPFHMWSALVSICQTDILQTSHSEANALSISHKDRNRFQAIKNLNKPLETLSKQSDLKTSF